MEKYTVAIEETVVEEFSILAESEQEAIDIAIKKYKTGEFVLSPGEVQFHKISVVEPSSKAVEWFEF